MTLAGAAGALAVGAVLDRCGPETLPAALAALAGMAWLTGLVSAELLARQYAPRSARRPRGSVHVRSALAAPRVRRGLRRTAAWNAAVGTTASLTVVVMLQHVHLPLIAVAAHGLVVAAASAAAAPVWGRLVDRAGVARVLVISAAGAATLPFSGWRRASGSCGPSPSTPCSEASSSGGQGIAASNLAVELAPRGRRAEVHASCSTAAGIAFAAASVASGVVTARLPVSVALGGGAAVRKLVFAAGGAARLGAAARVFRRERP